MAKALNKGLEGLGTVLDSRVGTMVIQGASIAVNTGAAPIPNCVSPILAALDKLQKTIAASKALRKRCSTLINTCVTLQDLIQTYSKDIEATKLEEVTSETLRILLHAQQVMNRHSNKGLFYAMWNKGKMKRDAADQASKVKTQLRIYDLAQSQEILSDANQIREEIERKNDQIEALANRMEAVVGTRTEAKAETFVLASGPVQMSNSQPPTSMNTRSTPRDPSTSTESHTSESEAGSTSGGSTAVGSSTEIDTEGPIESTEDVPKRTRYPVPELDRRDYGPAKMELGSKSLEYWIARRKGTIRAEQVAIRMPRDSVERHVKKGTKGIENELKIWSHLKHPCVVPLLGTMWFDLPINRKCLLGLVSPYYLHGNVIDYVKATSGVNRFQLLVDAGRGLEYLHSQCVAHGDVRGSSILINDREQAVIADFHMSCFVDVEADFDKDSEDEFEAELHWRAPELMVDYHPPTLESDIWSFAMTCYEVATGKKPLHADGLRTEVRAMIGTLAQGILPQRPPRNVWLTDDVWDLLTKCWNLKPERRPNIRDCLEVLRKANDEWLEEHKSDKS